MILLFHRVFICVSNIMIILNIPSDNIRIMKLPKKCEICGSEIKYADTCYIMFCCNGCYQHIRGLNILKKEIKEK